jgi:alkylhydroperoxidase family enzyme
LLQYTGVTEAGTNNLYETVVRHPGFFRKWAPLGAKLRFGGKLNDRAREVVILRTAWLCRSRYEWAHHVELALEVGLTDDEVEGIASGAGGSEPEDELLLRAVEELHAESRWSDETWKALRPLFTDLQLIELAAVVGHYHLVAFLIGSMGIELEHQPDDATTVGRLQSLPFA